MLVLLVEQQPLLLAALLALAHDDEPPPQLLGVDVEVPRPPVQPRGLARHLQGYRTAMAINRVRCSLPPEQVFDHLTNPWEYPQWLLGASKMRDVDDGWPAVGSRFHHTVGWGPVKIDDRSKVLEIDPPRRLVLHVKATPIVQGKVTFTVEAVDGGSLLTLQEEPAIAAGGLLRPVLDPATHARNKKSLEKLADLMHRGDGATAS